MKIRLFYPLLLLVVSPLLATAQTVADKLKELDRLRAEGLISEETYNEQWKKTIDEALRAPAAPDGPSPAAAPGSASVPRFTFAEPDRRLELGFSGSWMSLDAGDSDTETTSFDLALGYFATAQLQLTLGVDYFSVDVDSDNLDATGVSVGADWHFTDKRTDGAIVPYVGAGLSWMSIDADGDTEDDWAWEARAGFKQYLGDRVVIRYQAAYQSFDDLDLDGFGVSVGIGVRF